MSFGESLDGSLDCLEETRFKKKYSDMLQSLVKKLHFDYTELESALLIYYKIQRENADKHALITKTQFKEVLHNGLDMTDNFLMERIFSAIDRGPNPNITMETWLKAMSIFLRGNLEEKIAHSFSVYDTMNYGKISRDAMFQLLKTCLVSQAGDEDSEESIKDMLEVLTKKMDVDRDGKISLSDYRTTVLEQPLLLEALGQTVTSRLAAHAFLTSFTPHVGKL